jgi:hypothetical protein
MAGGFVLGRKTAVTGSWTDAVGQEVEFWHC